MGCPSTVCDPIVLLPALTAILGAVVTLFGLWVKRAHSTKTTRSERG